MKAGLANLRRANRQWPMVLAILMAWALVAKTRPAHAHALLTRSDPVPGVVLPVNLPATRISLWFTEPVEVAFNAIAVLDATNRRIERLNARVTPGEPRRVDVDLGEIGQGAYLVRWRVTSSDNHIVRGSYWFAVGFATTPPAAAALLGTGPPAVPLLEVAARSLGLMAILTLTGGLFFSLVVLRPVAANLAPTLSPLLYPPARPMRSVRLAAMIAFVVAQLLLAAAQIEAVAELPFPQALDGAALWVVFLGSRFALIWWSRLVLGLTIGTLLIGQVKHGGQSGANPEGGWLSLALAGALIATLALGGHAVGAWFSPPLAVAVDTVHLAAAALWLGGLVQLSLILPCILALPGEDRSVLLQLVVPRVSTVALGSVLVLLLTGFFNSWEQVGSLRSLFTTAYGQSLLVKLMLLLPLLGIAAANLLVIRPRIAMVQAAVGEQVSRRFRALVLAEIVVGGVLLLVVGLLTTLPPSGQQNFPAPVEIARQAGDLRVSLRVDPNWVGIGRFKVGLTDERGLPLTDVRQVVLTFTMEGMNMGRTNVTMTPLERGVYEAFGFYFGMPGIAQVGVAISRAGGVDRSAVFRIEIPDLNPMQVAGLPASLGIGPLGLFGLAILITVVAAAAFIVRMLVAQERQLAGIGAGLLVLLAAGLVLIDHRSVLDRSLSSNPIVPDSTSLARGRQLYTLHCAICHGENGNGDGPAAASLLPPPADLTLHARWHADEQLFWFVTNGVTGTTMLGFANRLSSGERWDIINYLHKLAGAPTATAARPPLVTTPQVARTPSPSPEETPSAPPSLQTVPREEPKITGRLVFGPDYDNNLWLLRLPEGKPEPLTKFGPKEFSSNPVWSPDGRRIAFSYYRLPEGGPFPVPDGTDLYVMKADGSDIRPVALHDTSGATLQYPTWAADGSALYANYVVTGEITPSVERVEVRSGARRRIVVNAAYPTLSRGGRRLAYVRFSVPPERGQSLWWSAPDGSRPQQILAPLIFEKYFALRFAPGGRSLLFAAVGQPRNDPSMSGGFLPGSVGFLRRLLQPPEAYANGDLWDLWSVDFDGRNLRSLTLLGEDLPVASWSPDGKHVAFLGGGSAITAEAGVTIITTQRKELRRLTTQPGHRGLDWAR